MRRQYTEQIVGRTGFTYIASFTFEVFLRVCLVNELFMHVYLLFEALLHLYLNYSCTNIQWMKYLCTYVSYYKFACILVVWIAHILSLNIGAIVQTSNSIKKTIYTCINSVTFVLSKKTLWFNLSFLPTS